LADVVDVIRQLDIGTPKRDRRLQTGWEGFFPYYAGYPESFVSRILATSQLKPGATVLDPWNGSGTTTYASAQLGFSARGYDLNPVMVVVARARLLSSSEADALQPLAATIVGHLKVDQELSEDDELTTWFTPATAAVIRGLEEEIRRTVVGELTVTPCGTAFGNIAGTAATLYVALFSACRSLAVRFKSSNPTWLRRPKGSEERVEASRSLVLQLFAENVRGMAEALAQKSLRGLTDDRRDWRVDVADTASVSVADESIDMVLTSPPYCTRIDYTAATRIELAVLAPLLEETVDDLGRRMIGTTQVPKLKIEPRELWGPVCNTFLNAVRSHPSKASSGYYYNTHLDYFDKMGRSLINLRAGLKSGGIIILVVQDSYYKELHNDLPKVIEELGERAGLEFVRSERFAWRQSMSRINPHTKAYQRPSDATESVLCFAKPS
jgi:hypothetical protein